MRRRHGQLDFMELGKRWSSQRYQSGSRITGNTVDGGAVLWVSIFGGRQKALVKSIVRCAELCGLRCLWT